MMLVLGFARGRLGDRASPSLLLGLVSEAARPGRSAP